MALSPSPPCHLASFVPHPGKLPGRSVHQQNSTVTKCCLLQTRGGVGTFRVIKCSLDKHIHSRKSAIFISGRPLSDVSAMVTQYKEVLYPCCWGPQTLSSFSQESLFSRENVGNQSCVCSCQGCISGSSRQDSGRISNILNDSTICKQYTRHLLVWEGECVHECKEKLTKEIQAEEFSQVCSSMRCSLQCSCE